MRGADAACVGNGGADKWRHSAPWQASWNSRAVRGDNKVPVCLECVFILNTCVFTCIQFESPKSAEYTYSKAYPRVFRM